MVQLDVKQSLLTVTLFVCLTVTIAVRVQEIDSLLAGGLTAEDEDDVQQELEQIIKVYCMCIELLIKYYVPIKNGKGWPGPLVS